MVDLRDGQLLECKGAPAEVFASEYGGVSEASYQHAHLSGLSSLWMPVEDPAKALSGWCRGRRGRKQRVLVRRRLTLDLGSFTPRLARCSTFQMQLCPKALFFPVVDAQSTCAQCVVRSARGLLARLE